MRLLISIVVLAVLFLAWAYYDVDSLNRAIEGAFGIRTVTLEELKEMADRGEIPLEVYKLALYKKLQDPKVFFKVWRGAVYEFPSGLALQGKYFERINESWIRVGIVQYDEERRDYLIVTVDVSDESIYPFWATGSGARYLLDNEVGEYRGNWSYTSESVNVSGLLFVRYYRNPNPEDWQIADEIAGQLLEYAKKYGMTKSQIAELFYAQVLHRVIPAYNGNPHWWSSSWNISVLNGSRIEVVTISKSDSNLKSVLLHDSGECFAYAYVATYVLNALGVETAMLIVDWGVPHAVVAISAEDLNVSELKYAPMGVYTADCCGIQRTWYPIEPQGVDSVIFEDIEANWTELEFYIKPPELEKSQNKKLGLKLQEHTTT